MTVTLKRIQVSGFKSIREMDLELTSLNVLIGANGAGKSNFISVFRLLNELGLERLQLYSGRVGANSLLYFGPKTTDEITVKVDFEEFAYKVTLLYARESRLTIGNEEVWLPDQDGATTMQPFSFGSGRPEAWVNFNHGLTVNNVSVPFYEPWRIYHFQDTSPEARVKQTQKIDDNRYLRPDGANLAPYLYLLQERYRSFYDRIVGIIRSIAPFFDTFVLAPDRLNPDNIRLVWRERGSDEYFDAHTLSDGTLRFICLTTLLLQPEPPSLILIDEPELGLHPYALNYLAGMIRSVSTQTQIIISTQSVTLLNQFTPEDVIVVDREDRQSVFKRLSSEELAGWLDEYSLGELWEKNVLGGRRQPQEP